MSRVTLTDPVMFNFPDEEMSPFDSKWCVQYFRQREKAVKLRWHEFMHEKCSLSINYSGAGWLDGGCFWGQLSASSIPICKIILIGTNVWIFLWLLFNEHPPAPKSSAFWRRIRLKFYYWPETSFYTHSLSAWSILISIMLQGVLYNKWTAQQPTKRGQTLTLGHYELRS